MHARGGDHQPGEGGGEGEGEGVPLTLSLALALTPAHLPPPSAARRGWSRLASRKWPRWLMPTVASKPCLVRSGASACSMGVGVG